MARAYHNLQGWLRDVRKAIDSGHQLAYEAAEVLWELDDLIDDSVDGAESGVEDGAGGTDDGAGVPAQRPDAGDELLGVQSPRSTRQPAIVAPGVRSDSERQERPRRARGLAGATGLTVSSKVAVGSGKKVRNA